MSTKRRVVASPAEARRSQVGDQLLDQGRKDFESVYGEKTPGSFSLKNDIKAMEEVNMMARNKSTQPKAAPQQANVPEMPVQQQPPIQAPVEQPPVLDQEEETPDQWSDDPQERIAQVANVLRKLNPNAPTVELLQSWKQMHGDIFLLNIEDKIFIYRFLKRQEWIQINANPQIEEMTEHMMEDLIFDKCVLWPQYDMIAKASMPAGAMSMVYQQVRIRSLFLDPAYVAQLTFKI